MSWLNFIVMEYWILNMESKQPGPCMCIYVWVVAKIIDNIDYIHSFNIILSMVRQKQQSLLIWWLAGQMRLFVSGRNSFEVREGYWTWEKFMDERWMVGWEATEELLFGHPKKEWEQFWGREEWTLQGWSQQNASSSGQSSRLQEWKLNHWTISGWWEMTYCIHVAWTKKNEFTNPVN